MKKLKLVGLILATPLLALAQSQGFSLHFFDAIPGFSTAKSKPEADSRRLSNLIDQFGASKLSEITNLQDLKLSGTADEKSMLLQRLIEYRAALRQGASTDMGSLEEDLNWSAKMGFPYPNGPRLMDILKTLQEKDVTDRIQYVRSLQEPSSRVMLEGAVGAIGNYSYTLDFLAKNPNEFSPERRSQLILNTIVNLSADGLSNQDISNMKTLSRLIDYQDPSVICQGGRLFAEAISLVGVNSASSLQIDYLRIFSNGLIEMQKKGLRCKDYKGGKSMAEVLKTAQQVGALPRGFAAASASGSGLTAATRFKDCQFDSEYRNTIHDKVAEYKSLSIGDSHLSVTSSKNHCSLEMISEKNQKGFSVRFVLYSATSAKLIDFKSFFLNAVQNELSVFDRIELSALKLAPP